LQDRGRIGTDRRKLQHSYCAVLYGGIVVFDSTREVSLESLSRQRPDAGPREEGRLCLLVIPVAYIRSASTKTLRKFRMRNQEKILHLFFSGVFHDFPQGRLFLHSFCTSGECFLIAARNILPESEFTENVSILRLRDDCEVAGGSRQFSRVNCRGTRPDARKRDGCPGIAASPGFVPNLLGAELWATGETRRVWRCDLRRCSSERRCRTGRASGFGKCGDRHSWRCCRAESASSWLVYFVGGRRTEQRRKLTK